MENFPRLVPCAIENDDEQVPVRGEQERDTGRKVRRAGTGVEQPWRQRRIAEQTVEPCVIAEVDTDKEFGAGQSDAAQPPRTALLVAIFVGMYAEGEPRAGCQRRNAGAIAARSGPQTTVAAP